MGLQISSDTGTKILKNNNIWSFEKVFGYIFKNIPFQKESKILEGHLMGEHVYMMISMPPKYAVSQLVGYINCEAIET